MSGFFSPAPLATLTPVEKVKSLNIAFRKKENERIERENHGLAKRLFSNPSTISKRDMDKEFQRQAHYRQMIARVKVDKPTFMGRVGSLPPLRNTVQARTKTLEGEGSAAEFDRQFAQERQQQQVIEEQKREHESSKEALPANEAAVEQKTADTADDDQLK